MDGVVLELAYEGLIDLGDWPEHSEVHRSWHDPYQRDLDQTHLWKS